MTEDDIISCCRIIEGWAVRRGRATLARDKTEYDRCDKVLKELIEKFKIKMRK